MKFYQDAFTTLCARTPHSSVWVGDRAKILIRHHITPDIDEVVTVRMDPRGNIQIFYSPSLSGRLTCKPGNDDELS